MILTHRLSLEALRNCGDRKRISYLGIGEPSQKGNDVVHHILIVDDAVLALLHEHDDEVAEAGAEFFPHGTWFCKEYEMQLMTNGLT